jgi:hypothetical protein
MTHQDIIVPTFFIRVAYFQVQDATLMQHCHQTPLLAATPREAGFGQGQAGSKRHSVFHAEAAVTAHVGEGKLHV